MRRMAVVIALGTAGACGDNSGGQVSEMRAVCRLVGDRLDRRLGVLEGDIESMNAMAERHKAGTATDADYVRFDGMAREFYAYHHATSAVSSPCITVGEARRACDIVAPPTILDQQSIAASMNPLRRLRSSLRGDGPCTAPDSQFRNMTLDGFCSLITLNLTVPPREIEAVRTRTGEDSLAGHNAAGYVARWRAELDIALAMAPICLPQAVRASCLAMGSSLVNAAPDDLVAMKSSLREARLNARPCPAARAP